jgi:Raf kinase inhibitor-like YbhB/YbcL family protein
MDIGHALKCIATGMPVMFTGGQPGCRAGEERLSYSKIDAPEVLTVWSEGFEPGRAMHVKYSQDGQNISPPIEWKGVPAGTEALALLVEDPDSPTPEPYVHWMVYNMEPGAHGLPEGYMGMSGPSEGKNSTWHSGYVGMAPPKGDLPHHYHFQLFALDRRLDLVSGTGRTTLLHAMKGHVIGKGRLVGMFSR